VRVLRSLNHPNIAATYGLVDVDRMRALAFEWVDGPSLAERIAQGAVLIDEALPIAAQIADALGAAYERAVVHRDVRPSNIKLGLDSAVKVLDFGLAEVFESEPIPNDSGRLPAQSARLMGVITGTAAYMSPEQVHGLLTDCRTDVWAFGCVVYEMLTGRPAFGGEDLSETLASVINAEPEWTLLPTATPWPIERALRKCLDKSARTRLQDLAEVSRTIRGAISEGGAFEAFLRQSALDQMSAAPARPQSAVERLPAEVQEQLPALKRWASRRVPRTIATNMDDVVEDAVKQVVARLETLEPRHARALEAHLRQAALNLIRDEIRRHSHPPGAIEGEAPERYRDAMDRLSPRDRDRILDRIEEEHGYEKARRWSIRGPHAARIALMRALRRIIDRIRGRKPD